jgi:2-iminobutanoate/2-iminopropanoate deaminase
MDREVIKITAMPTTNPTYSQAIKGGGFLFLAGQIGLDYATGQLASGGMRDQTRHALENVRAILEAAGSSLDRVVSVSIFITNWDEWGDFNEVYAEFFPENGPAKTTAQVSRLAFEALVEIQVTALA